MLELDTFIQTNLQETISTLNKKVKGKRVFSNLFNSIKARKKKLFRYLKREKDNLIKLPLEKNSQVNNSRKNVFNIVKQIRKNNHHKNRVSSTCIYPFPPPTPSSYIYINRDAVRKFYIPPRDAVRKEAKNFAKPPPPKKGGGRRLKASYIYIRSLKKPRGGIYNF